jgi:hypothetical protein
MILTNLWMHWTGIHRASGDGLLDRREWRYADVLSRCGDKLCQAAATTEMVFLALMAMVMW